MCPRHLASDTICATIAQSRCFNSRLEKMSRPTLYGSGVPPSAPSSPLFIKGLPRLSAVPSTGRPSLVCNAVERLPLHVGFPSDNRYLIRSPLPLVQQQEAQLKLLTDDTLGEYSSGFADMREMDYYLDDSQVCGEIPKELRSSTFLQNGPGLFQAHGRPVSNPVDGDGMICSLAFSEHSIFFRSRFVKTPQTGQAGASAFEKPQISGIEWPFGLKLPKEIPLPANLSSKNPANQGLITFGRRVLALHEGAPPLLLDGSTLDTLSDMQALRSTVEGPLAPRYRTMTDTDGNKMYVAFGVSPSGPDAVATIYEFGHNSELRRKKQVHLPRAANGFIHDIAVTENFYVLVEHPCEVDIEKVLTHHLLGRASAAECMFLNKERQTKIHVIPRGEAVSAGDEIRALRPVQTLLTSPIMALQHINAYELDGGNRIILDTNLWSEFDFGFNIGVATVESLSQSPAPVVARLDINLVTTEVQGRILSARPCCFSCLHPAMTGQPYEASFLAVSSIDGMAGPPQALMRLTTDPLQGSSCSVGSVLWEPGPGKFVGPPTFVPHDPSDPGAGGWLLTMVFDARSRTSSLAIIDGQRLAAGPVATVNFLHHVPHGLQSVFSQGTYLGPAKTAPKGWTPALHPSTGIQ